MNKLNREDLFSLEKYAEVRPEFRARVMAHKKNRQLPIGPNATLYFEDALTMQYQVQEMLRIERIFEAAGIQEELDAYNPLIPDGSSVMSGPRLPTFRGSRRSPMRTSSAKTRRRRRPSTSCASN
jgi:hypothetical protein